MSELPLFPALQADWERFGGHLNSTCGSQHRHKSGYVVQHCGHPTANYPYYIITPAGEMVLAENGRGFRLLADAKKKVEELTNGHTR